MRDRLKENISIIKQHNERHIPVFHITDGKKHEIEVIAEIVEDVSLIIEKMENQTLIELPCKVGDKAYHLTSIDTLEELELAEIFDGEVCSISKDEKTLWIFAHYDNGLNFWYAERDIGRRLFFTKEEAEKALAERSGK